MACNYPIATKRKDGSPCMRPCGHCLGCHLNYSRQWAIRSVHEASLHKKNCFITLTMRDEDLPLDMSVHREDIQKFIKRLRDRNDYKDIRYLASGEYGDKGSRPHYHLCLFGHDFSDKVLRRSGKRAFYKSRVRFTSEYDIYSSKELEELWPYGFNTIGEVTYASAAYVARYIIKKSPKGSKYPDGRLKEFALMSKYPALGKRWLEKYFTDVYPKDYLHVEGKLVPPPRYYDSLCKKWHPEIWKEVQERRIKRGVYNAQGTPEMVRKHEKEIYRKAVTKRLERHYEND